jgi:hypothetical protein
MRGSGRRHLLARRIRWSSSVLAACPFPGQSGIKQIYEFFLHPPHTDDCPMAWKPPDIDSLFSFLVRQHAFSETRVQAAAQRLQTSFDRARDRLATSAIHA